MQKRLMKFLITIFLILCLSGVAYTIAKAELEYSVKSYGAIGDGRTDDTVAIQNAINTAKDIVGSTVYFPKGKYLINTTDSLKIYDNMTLLFEEGAELIALPSKADSYEIIKIHNIKNIRILGHPTIIGERYDHLGSTGEWGMGISIKGSESIYIENAVISDCWGDGIYVGSTTQKNYSENIEIKNVKLFNNRRQGMSIISVENLLVQNTSIENTNGTNPQGGLVFEPNNSNERVVNVKINNLQTNNNVGGGLNVYLGKLKGSVRAVNLYVNSIEEINDGVSVKGIGELNGNINIAGYYYLSDKEIVAKPTVNPITNKSSLIIGTAVKNTTIRALVDGKVIGSVKSNSDGAYSISIPKQSVGKSVSLIAEDQFKNLSKETIVVVSKYIGERPERLAGTNRYQTAIEISKRSWTTSDTVVLATGESFPDALTGGPLAYREKAPILLTKTMLLNQETEKEIIRLKSKKVIILGSEMAVSAEVESVLKKRGLLVERIGGANRYETAALIAERLNSQTAVIGSGQNFPDILSVSPYASRNGIPILLTRKDNLPEETKKAITEKTQTFVVGGMGVIEQSVLDELPSPKRFGGANRYETSKAVIKGLPLGIKKGFIATGKNFPDALAGSQLAALNNSPILLVEEQNVPEIYLDILGNYKAFSILGSTAVVGVEVENQLFQALTN